MSSSSMRVSQTKERNAWSLFWVEGMELAGVVAVWGGLK